MEALSSSTTSMARPSPLQSFRRTEGFQQLRHERKMQLAQLSSLQSDLTEARLQEVRAQQRVKKDQSMMQFHRSRAAIVAEQILRVTQELQSQERTAWRRYEVKRAELEQRASSRRACEDRPGKNFPDMGPLGFASKGADRQALESSKNKGPSAQSTASRRAPAALGTSAPAAAAAAAYKNERRPQNAEGAVDQWPRIPQREVQLRHLQVGDLGRIPAGLRDAASHVQPHAPIAG